jgi:hypothetical protein
MNARLAALLTALETLVVVGIGVGIFFAPLSLVWAIDDQFSTDLLTYWRVSADFWMIGHGVPVSVSLTDDVAQSLGLAQSQRNFILSAAPLGPAVLTLWWGFRMGRRDLMIDYPIVVWLVGLITLAGLSYGIHASAHHVMATADVVEATLRPSLFLAAGLIIASWTSKWAQGRQWLQSSLSESAWGVLSAGVKAGIGAAFGLLGIAGMVFAGMLLFSYATVVGLFESLGPSVIGLIVLFLGQLAFVPSLVVFVSSWLVGPGFSLGTAAQFSPLGTDIQALPALPILAALPTNPDSIGFTIIAIPVLAALAAGALAEREIHRGTPKASVSMSPGRQTAAVFGSSVIATAIGVLIVAVPASLASGALGPGRFQMVGIDLPQLVLWWGVELFAGVVLGMVIAKAIRWIRAQEHAVGSVAAR